MGSGFQPELGLLPRLLSPESLNDVPYWALPNRKEPRFLLPRRRSLAADLAKHIQTSHPTVAAVRRMLFRLGMIGESVGLDGSTFTSLLRSVEGAAGEEDLVLGLAIGRPGAYQKIVAVAGHMDGVPIAFAKVADHPLAHERLDRERRTLEVIGLSGLTGAVPAVVAATSVLGYRLLILSAGPPIPGPRHLGDPHLRVMQGLQSALGSIDLFQNSTTWRRLERGADVLNSSLSARAAENVRLVLAQLEANLVDVAMPLWRSHGDLTPWNTKLHPDGSLFLVDWEASEPAMIPMFDLFYFEISRAASRSWNKSRNWRLGGPVIDEAFGRLWPEGMRYKHWLGLAALAYVTHTYAEARSLLRRDRPGPVWRFIERAWSELAVTN